MTSSTPPAPEWNLSCHVCLNHQAKGGLSGYIPDLGQQPGLNPGIATSGPCGLGHVDESMCLSFL